MCIRDSFPVGTEDFVFFGREGLAQATEIFQQTVLVDNGSRYDAVSYTHLIPPELNAKNKRFILKRLNEHAKFDRVENSFLWLTNAGVALPVYNVEEPKMPLLLARSRNL